MQHTDRIYRWAASLLQQLSHQGVEEVCIAPGSRSTALAVAASDQSSLRKTVHFDERALGFYALGLARASRRPVALIISSGTAVGNLLPAVMEAHHDRIPLILLTADRPPELRACGANQTTDQVKFFESFVRWHVDLPCADDAIPLPYLKQTAAHAVYQATRIPAGPVHINWMIREPSPTYPSLKLLPLGAISYERGVTVPTPSQTTRWAERLRSYPRGIILVGSHPRVSPRLLTALADRLGWPIYGDLLSDLRGTSASGWMMRYGLWTLSLWEAGAILQFGDRFTHPKPLFQWIHSQRPGLYAHVAEHPCRHDPEHLITHRWEGSPDAWIESVLQELPDRGSAPMPADWLQDEEERIHHILIDWLQEHPHLSEPALMLSLGQWLPSHIPLFIGSSMPIRDADRFFFPEKREAPFFANRGLSGIDGNIATACGIARGTGRPSVAIIGDQAFFHDATSLHLMQNHPLILVVINNGGGTIFNQLPIGQNPDLCDRYFTAPHELRCGDLARTWEIAYSAPASLEEWHQELSQACEKGTSCLIEVVVNRHTQLTMRQEIEARIAQAYATADKP